MAQKRGTVRAEIIDHGQYETTAKALDDLIDRYWEIPRKLLEKRITEYHGNPQYGAGALTKIELIMILAELDGFATN